jgi:spermidine synthase
MVGRSLRVAALLFGSGLCALVYQTCWLRELRLTFGASTPASAAVLAVFMGGLGFGALALGKRVERARRPLQVYANLELGIALFAALTPLTLGLARRAYVAAGGTAALGSFGGTALRLALSAIVLLPPTFLMGGTLPAAAKSCTDASDSRRIGAALLYGLNTLGAVAGALASTFFLLERYGTRRTLWLACLLNAVVAIAAHLVDRVAMPESNAPVAAPSSDPSPAVRAAPLPFTLTAAAVTGFAFLAMELCWYRVLSPLLGGSSFTFGLILAVALFGIGAGGLWYGAGAASRPATLSAFALTCGLEAACLALPYAIGDGVPFIALSLRPLGTIGLGGYAIGWAIVSALVALPAAIVAGYQFPLLIALLGRGDRDIGRDIGLCYAFNTIGSIVGSIAAGFFLLPHIGALGTWRLAVWMLALLGAAALYLARRREILPALTAVAALAAIYVPPGPTAFWRHSPIGAGRADDAVGRGRTRNTLREVQRRTNRSIAWEADGRESTVALYTGAYDMAFLVNGKSDGASILDSGTQVMSGMLGALLYEGELKSALVIGLGTGSTGGWLGAAPGIEHVDVVELEPAIRDVARACSAVNHGVLDNPKVAVTIGDAREVLLTSRSQYDLVFSEPSNPYRAGVASLFTREYYQAVRARLRPRGLFLQWMQAYEIDAKSIRVFYATLKSVFPSVSSWRTKSDDLLLVASDHDLVVDVDRLRARMAEPTYKEALFNTWRANTVEDVLARFLAPPALATAIAARDGERGINSDDKNLLEFSIARALGRDQDFAIEDVQRAAAALGEWKPELTGASAADVDWDKVADAEVAMHVVELDQPRPATNFPASEAAEARSRAMKAWLRGDLGLVTELWHVQKKAPDNVIERMVLGDGYASLGDDRALPLAASLMPLAPVDAKIILARYHYAKSDWARAWQLLDEALALFERDPWGQILLVERAITLALHIAEVDAAIVEPRDPVRQARIEAIYERLSRPLVLHVHDDLRRETALDVAMLLKDGPRCAASVAAFGRYFPWQRTALEQRMKCYGLAKSSAAPYAIGEWERFLDDSGTGFASDLGQK